VKKVKVTEPHYYAIHRVHCVLCGKIEVYRERMAGKRPVDYEDTWEDIGCYSCQYGMALG